MAFSIIWRGTGLMAGSPTAIGNPGLVIVPTPLPCRNRTPCPDLPKRSSAMIKAPWVTSGSSPASFIMPAIAISSDCSCISTAKEATLPLGVSILTHSGNFFVIRAVYDAIVAAVAQVPVVQPNRRLVVNVLAIEMLLGDS